MQAVSNARQHYGDPHLCPKKYAQPNQSHDPIPEDDDGYKSNGTVVNHTNLRFWCSHQQNVRRIASPSAVSATSMDEHRANPIATLTAASTIVNAPGNTQPVTYTGLMFPSRQTTVPQQITVLELTTLPDPINAAPVHAPIADTAIKIPSHITHPSKTSLLSLLKLSGKTSDEAALQYILDLRARVREMPRKLAKPNGRRSPGKGPHASPPRLPG